MTQVSLKNASDIFNINSNIEIAILEQKQEFVPKIDDAYHFNDETTNAIIAGFKYNKKLLIQGYHGTGKSTHIEQVAARLNWPLIRINLDGQISRIDLLGRDIITIKDGFQITEFSEGILPWTMKNGIALILDEYDACRPEVAFILNSILEPEGTLALLEKNQKIIPHKNFRIFATSNTIGLGDQTGLYSGVNYINQAQMDRWNIVVTLNYLPKDEELKIIINKLPIYQENKQQEIIKSMIDFANLTRNGFALGEISSLISLRTIINWAENNLIFNNLELSFKYSFLNKCDQNEKEIMTEYYQRIFGIDPK